MNNEQKFYTIMVGGEPPADVLYGNLNKDSMQPDEGTVKGKIQLGVVGIPNYSNVWALRLVDQKTKAPNGQLEFLKWGTDKEKDGQQAGVVEIRYLPNSQSLDKQYQTLTQKIIPKDDSPINEISLLLGLNKFDYKNQGQLIKMLKYHTFNGDNPSRDPNNTNIQYVEYNPSDRIQSKTRAINTRRLAEEYVMNCEEDDKALACLADIFEMNLKDTDEILYNQLLELATETPDRFILIMQTKRDELKAALQSAHESGFADFATPLEVSLRNGSKKDLLIEGMETFDTVEDKVNYLVKNFEDPRYYEALIKIKAKVKEFQMAQLQ